MARPAFFTAIFFGFFINVLAFVGPLYMLQIYDRVIPSRNALTLLFLTLISVFLLLVYAALEKVRAAVLMRVGLLFDFEVRSELFQGVLRASLKQPDKAHYSVLRELDVIREFLTGAGLISFCDAPWVPIFIVGCFILHPWFGWIATVGAILIFAFALANELLTRDQFRSAGKAAIEAGVYATATIRNVEALHAMGMWRPLRDRWLTRQNAMLALIAVASDRSSLLVAATKFFRAFLQVAILGAGAYLAIIHEASAGAMIAASIIMGRALAPVEIMVGQWKTLLAARSAWARITELLNILPAQQTVMKLPDPEGHLSVQSIIVIPPASKLPVLHGISFSLAAGSSLGVIGQSAAGKSSLARAIVGVWPALTGAIRVDGHELAHWDNEQLGRHVGYLPQDVELLAGTVAENIARFEAIDERMVIAAAQMAGVHAMVQSLPGGYNTQIGDGGQSLSGGQRQRIGLARALYRMPPLIVLDEPNASLDAEGEEALIATLQQLKSAKRTVILITHKTNILAVMDKILALAHGRMLGFDDRDVIFGKFIAPRMATIGASETVSRKETVK